MNIHSRAHPLLLALAILLAAPVEAQVPVEFPAGSAVVSREALTDLLQQYEAAAASPAYSGRIRDQARAAADRIRSRLDEGDFRVGDRIVLEVQGEPNLTETFPVEPGPQITLPLMGAIPLQGVLRSEITQHLTTELGRFIRDPIVRAQGLMRLSVQGAVGDPGFYVVRTDMLLSEALMEAGGPNADADLQALRIERGTESMFGEGEADSALREGLTLDQLNLRAGDQIFLPTSSAGQNYLITIGRGLLVAGSVLLLGVRIF